MDKNRMRNKATGLVSKGYQVFRPPPGFSKKKKIITITVIGLSLVLIIFGIIASSIYHNRATRLWYENARRLVEKETQMPTNNIETSARIASLDTDKAIEKKMTDINSLPSSSMENQRMANITGCVGFFGLLLLASCIAWYWMQKKKAGKGGDVTQTMQV